MSMTPLIKTWKHNIRRNVNSDFSIVTMRRFGIIFFNLGVIKKFHAKILIARHFMITFLFKNCP